MGLRVLKVWEYWRFEIFEGLKLPIQAFEIIQNFENTLRFEIIRVKDCLRFEIISDVRMYLLHGSLISPVLCQISVRHQINSKIVTIILKLLKCRQSSYFDVLFPCDLYAAVLNYISWLISWINE